MTDESNDDDASLLAPLTDDEPMIDAAIVDSLLDEPCPTRVRKRQKDELIYLRKQVAELSAHLAALTNDNATKLQHCSTRWERVAQNQKMAAQQATMENARLKRSLEDQLHLATALDKLLVKRPRLAVMAIADTADWKLRRLPSEPAARTAALDKILTDAYENVESLFVRSRILEAAPGHRSLSVTEVDDTLSVAVESVAELPNSFLDASNNVWSFWATSDGLQLSFSRYERLQTVGNDTVYCRVTACMDEGVPCIGMLYAIKRFVENDRVVFVLKTILEDENYPWPPGLLVGNHTASIVVEAAGDNQCIRRMVVAGKISTQLPDESPLLGMPATIGEVVLKIVRPVFDTLEFLLS